MNKESSIIIRELAGDRIVCQSNSQETDAILISSGFEKEGSLFIKNIQKEDDRINIINILVDNNALFSQGRDWSPAELVLYYREKGLISGKILIISWINPEEYIIKEE